MDYSKPDHPPPEKLKCYRMSHKDTFTSYSVEQHDDFYRWFDHLTQELSIPNKTKNEYAFWDVHKDHYVTHGPNEDVLIVHGDEKTMLFFKEEPDPEVMLEHIDMVEYDASEEKQKDGG